nr:hypothetical protein [Nostoc sp. ChiSLP03a]MDZ8210770.1 hypothetical protein [Nostoc sp. ChiSLP03a]
MSSKLGINDITFFTEIPDSELQNINGGATGAEKIGLGLGAIALGVGLAPFAAGSVIVGGAIGALGVAGGWSIGSGLYKEFKEELNTLL